MGLIGAGSFYLPIFLLAGATVAWTNNDSLRMVNVLFRHGDRTPDNNGFEMYPNDPYLNHTFYPMGLGQLTNAGKRREFKIGEVLRERYGDFLGKIYSPKLVYGLSSDYDRTKMSLQLVLAGLFPPEPIQTWIESLKWQPTSTKYIAKVEDNLFLPDDCPLFKAEYNRVLKTPEVREQLSVYNDLMEFLTEKTGKRISTPLDLFYMYHTFVAESSMGLALPSWAEKIFPYGKLWNATVFSYDVGNYNQRLRRLYGGPYLRVIGESMEGYVEGTLKDPKRIYLYSGHETNIASVLYALGLYYPHVPEYSSAVITELHLIDGRYYVKVLYYTGIPAKIHEMAIPGCKVYCPYEKYLELTENVIPSDEDLVCDKRLTTAFKNHRTREGEETMIYNLIRNARNIEDY